MTTESIDLDQHRSDDALRATEIRRRLEHVREDRRLLDQRQNEFETFILAGPATNWPEAAAKAHYLIQLLADTYAVRDPRQRKLIDHVFSDFANLSEDHGPPSVPLD